MIQNLGIRWTVGDVSLRGWEALRLSVHTAVNLFGPTAEYVICVNTVGLHQARELAGGLPSNVRWHEVTGADIPAFLRPHLDHGMAEGVGWKLLPVRIFPEKYELSLDNDCLLWSIPGAMQEWLTSTYRTLLAGDTERCLGIFQDAAVPGEINSGIRGLPPGLDLAAALAATLEEASLPLGAPIQLTSELDEQGLQAVATHRTAPALIVSTQEVSICSPFWPRNPELGSCGAHFVGLNSRQIPWDYYDRPGTLVRQEHWDRHRAELYCHAGLSITPPLPLGESR